MFFRLLVLAMLPSAEAFSIGECPNFFDSIFKESFESCMKKECPGIANKLPNHKRSSEDKGITAEERCRIGCELVPNFAEQRVPKSPFVNRIHLIQKGNGKAADEGSLVTLKYSGCVSIDGKENVIDNQPLRLRLDDSSLGMGLRTALINARSGDRMLVKMREETARGIREKWRHLPAKASLQLIIDIQLVM